MAAPKEGAGVGEVGALLGTYRRFGKIGPVYEVVEAQGDASLIRLVESGRTERYPLQEARLDPTA